MVASKKYDPAEVYARAHTAGINALNAAAPTPMIVSDDPLYMSTSNTYYVSEGMCGFAWIDGIRANSAMGKFLVGKGVGRRSDYKPGVSVWVTHGNQSVERKEAYAHAFAAVLQESGIKCWAESRLD